MKTTETEEWPETPTCAAKDCDQPPGRVRVDTHKALADLCKRDRKLATDRARGWGLTLAESAQTLRDGVTRRTEVSAKARRDLKPANRSQGRERRPRNPRAGSRKKASKPARKVSKPKAPPSPVATLASAITSRLGGLSEDDVRRIAHEVVQEELRKLAEAIG